MDTPKMTKAQAGAIGGKKTADKYGHGYMSSIGRRGAVVTWSKYRLVPVGVSDFAMVNKATGEVKALINNGSLMASVQAKSAPVTEF